MQPIRPHTRFRRSVRLESAEIAAFARFSGDANPLHHDRQYARARRHADVIASGPHTSSLLMGVVATHFSRAGTKSEGISAGHEGMGVVGLEFDFYFRAPVPADQVLELEWLVIAVRPTRKGGHQLVDLRGRLKLADGRSAVGARGRVLVGPSL